MPRDAGEGKAKKSAQVNIRFTPHSVAALDHIADREHRDRSELARFLLEWAIAKYERAGSLTALLNSDVITQTEMARGVYEQHQSTHRKQSGGSGRDKKAKAV